MWIRGSAVAAAVVLALAGCNADADPKPLPPLPSVSPTPVVLEVPPEAMEETSEGAAAFARYYLQLLGTAFATADPSALRAASAPGCGGCDALIESVESLGPKGHRRVGGHYEVKDVAAPPVEDGDVVLLISYERAESKIVDDAGAVVATGQPVPLTTAQMRLIRRGDSWVVQGYMVLED